MSSLYSGVGIENVDFRMDGPRAFQQTFDAKDRTARRMRRVDAEKQEQLAALANGSVPDFWSKGASMGLRRPAEGAHPFEQVAVTGGRKARKSAVQLAVPEGAAFASIVRRTGNSLSKPEMVMLESMQQTLLVPAHEEEHLTVGFCAGDGSQIGTAHSASHH